MGRDRYPAVPVATFFNPVRGAFGLRRRLCAGVVYSLSCKCDKVSTALMRTA